MSSAPSEPGSPHPVRGLPRGTVLFLTAASFCIVVAGLKAAASLIVPVLFAGFLSMLCFPSMRSLQRRGLGAGLAITVVVSVATVVVVAIITVVGTSVSTFEAEAPKLTEALGGIDDRLVDWVRELPFIPVEAGDRLDSILDPTLIVDVVSGVASATLSALSDLFVIVLLMVFMLIEANCLRPKIQDAFTNSSRVLADLSHVKEQVAGYVSIKAATSLLTGVLAGLLAFVTGLGFPILWGFVAFLFNFVPNIGSIIAAVPPVLLAWAEIGPGTALVVAAGYAVINTLVGNVLEPRVMGSRLGLSALVVILSLIFWSWVWGPIGMLLSVPLTVVVKIVFEQIEDLRPIAVLLGPEGEAGET